MSLTVVASGTLTASSSEQTLSDNATDGRVRLRVNLASMAAGDVVVLRVYTKVLTGDTYAMQVEETFYNAQPTGEVIFQSDEIVCNWGSKTTVQQTAGTNRDFPWAVLQVPDASASSPPTAAQVATAVWQDTTAGDFTLANSVGKSLMNGVSLGTGLTVARCTLTDTLTTYTGNTPQTGDSYAIVNSATFGNAALRDRGDAAWITATGFSTHTAADVWAVATRVLTAGTNIVLAKGTGVTGFNDLSAAQVNAEADTALADYDGPTKAEMDSAFSTLSSHGDLTWATATGFSTFDPATDVVAHVTLVDTTTTNTDMRGTDSAALASVWTPTIAGRIDAAVSTRATPAQVATELATYDGPTHAEMTGELATADDATLAAIAALNDFDPSSDKVYLGDGTHGGSSATLELAAMQVDGDFDIQGNLKTAAIYIGTKPILFWADSTYVYMSVVDKDGSAIAKASAVDDLPTNSELATALDAVPTAAENATGLLDLAAGVETGLTLRQALRLIAAASAGKLSGAATTTIVIRNAVADSKDRITATVTADGDRTAISYDLT